MGEGLLALVGVARGDGPEDAAFLAEKLVHLRVLADARQGRRPSWLEAAAPEAAEPLVSAVVDAARARGVQVVTGRFRAEMEVALVNTGPVTLLLDSTRAF